MQNNLQDSLNKMIRNYIDILDGTEPDNLYQLVLAQVEPTLLKAVLEKTKNNQCMASRWLGISRSTLRKKLALYNI